MKKNILFTVLVIACIAMALPAFASPTTITTGNTTQIGGANFVPSTNVSLSAYSGPAGAAIAYAVTSVHSSSLNNAAGREWGSFTGGASAIYYKSCEGKTALDATDKETDLPGGYGSWTAQ
jgi:hypothetical protein